MQSGSAQADRQSTAREALIERYQSVRAHSVALAKPLSPEDMAVQSMTDASPTKWHLAHVTWFFETFILERFERQFRPHHEAFRYLFNSYYVSVGERHARPHRGLLSRPSVDEIFAYRHAIDTRIECLLTSHPALDDIAPLLTLGLNHEQQHQELLLMDIKHAFAQNPLQPTYTSSENAIENAGETADRNKASWISFDAGIRHVGRNADGGFCFDNETPMHRQFVNAFELANRPVSNDEYDAFIADGGYQRAEFWLSDGWDTVQREGWSAPLYWGDDDTIFTLHGPQTRQPSAPVCHISYYEADAYARWAQARLPTEAEWETAAAGQPITGPWLDDGTLHPQPDKGTTTDSISPFGGVWEWTASPYAAYPGYRPLAGAIGEYNGKFMANQMVMRGGCCVTPAGHVRATYRNFFYPHMRWQFGGLRLARGI